MPRAARLLIALSFVGTAAFAVAFAQGGIAALGLQEGPFRTDVVGWVTEGRLNYYPARKAFNAAPPPSRAALARTAMAAARAYTETAAFEAAYKKYRESQAPNEPPERSVDAELAKEKAERQKSVEEARKNLEKMPPEIRAQMEMVVKQMAEQNAKFDSDPQMMTMARQGKEMQIAQERKDYESALARYSEKFPADPKVLIAGRLRQFLDASKDVDFSAKVTRTDGISRFQDPAYESKPRDWKLYYRAGPDAVGAAREFAEEWLKALGTTR